MKKIVKINSEGRIVIPSDIRKALNLKDNDEMTIELDSENKIKVEPLTARCAICNSTEQLHQSGDLIVCDECLEKIKLNLHLIEEELNYE